MKCHFVICVLIISNHESTGTKLLQWKQCIISKLHTIVARCFHVDVKHFGLCENTLLKITTIRYLSFLRFSKVWMEHMHASYDGGSRIIVILIAFMSDCAFRAAFSSCLCYYSNIEYFSQGISSFLFGFFRLYSYLCNSFALYSKRFHAYINTTDICSFFSSFSKYRAC